MWQQVHLFIVSASISSQSRLLLPQPLFFFLISLLPLFLSHLFSSSYKFVLFPDFPSGSSCSLLTTLFLFHSLWVFLPLYECKTDFKPSPLCSSSISLFSVISFSLSLWLSSVWTHDCRNVHTISQTDAEMCALVLE